MIKGYNIKNTISEDRQFIFTQKLENGLQFYTQIVFGTEDLVDYQKDIVNDYIGDVIENVSRNLQNITEKEIKDIFSESLHKLNKSFQIFADKLDSHKYISMRGISWIVYNGNFLSSMIGDMSMLIFRENHIYYKVHNDQEPSGKIDTFSDFIDGELEYGDKILAVSTNYKNLLTKNDLKELENILEEKIEDIMGIFYQVFTAKIGEDKIGFLNFYDYNNSTENSSLIKKISKKNILNQKTQKISKKLQHFIIKYKYPLVVSFCFIFVLIIGYNLVFDIIKTQDDIPKIQTEEGTKEITISSIRKDIYLFEKTDPLSNEKKVIYKEIMEQIKFLEEKKLWLEDVNKLKTIIKNKYYKGFNVAVMENTNTDIKKIYEFTSEEQKALGKPLSLLSNEVFSVGGSHGALLGAVNDDIKGTLVNANIESKIKKCVSDFAKNGLFCFTDTNKLLHITKGGVYDMRIVTPQKEGEEEQEEIAFDGPITDLATYRKNNFYVLHKDQDLIKEKKYITRYVTAAGNNNLFKPGIQYRLLGSEGSGGDLGFNNFSIDSTFVSWSSSKDELYQLRRDKGIDTINARKINIQGGDVFEDKYSSEIKVINNLNTEYIYLFDPKNQTFTVYKTSPKKTNEKFLYSYNLMYLMRFKFELLNNKIIDVSVPEKSGNKPYLYLLTKSGISQIDLTEFIKKYEKENE